MIILASDHGGYELKVAIRQYLDNNGYEYIDVGCEGIDSCDYPEFAHSACMRMVHNDIGIFVCGSGNGIQMAANSHDHIRAALCWKPELASLARQHNNANVMTLPGRFIEEEEALECVKNFITDDFEGGRHDRRVRKIKYVPGPPHIGNKIKNVVKNIEPN